MKKIFYFLASAIVALGAMACQNEVDESINPNTQSEGLSFTATINQDTKVAWEGLTPSWEVGDVVIIENFEIVEKSFEFVYDGEKFTCTEKGVEDLVGTTVFGAYGKIDSTKGLKGTKFTTNGEMKAEGTTLAFSPANALLKFKKAASNVTLKCDGATVLPISVDALTPEADGTYYVAIFAGENSPLSYSVNGTLVKSTTMTFEAGKIYNLGTLGANMTIANVAALIENAEAGSTITLPAGATITGSDILVISKNITINGNGATLSSTAGRAINVSGEGVEVAISNLTIECTGERGVNVIQNAKSVTLTDVNITAANYAVNVALSASGAVVNVNKSELTGLNVVNVGANNITVNVSESTINSNSTSQSEGYAALYIGDNTGSNIYVTESNIVTSGTSKIAVSVNKESHIFVDGTEVGIPNPVAKIMYGDYFYTFETLKDAIDFAKDGETVILIADVALEESLTIAADKEITLDLAGHTISYTSEISTSMIINEGNLTITGAEEGSAIAYTCTVGGSAAANTIANRGTLVIESGNITNTGKGNQIGYAIDNYNGATLTVNGGNIKASGSGYYDGIRLFCGNKETTVTVNGGTISSIWAQNPTAEKAGEVKGTVIVNSNPGGTIYYENYTTVKVKEGVTANVQAYGLGTVYAAETKVEDGYTVHTITIAPTAVEKLNAQIANSEGNTTITLTEDIVAGENEMITIPAGKTITLNLNGKTISQEKECTASHQLIKNNGTLTITGNGKISFKDTSAGDSTFGWGSYTIHNSGNLTVENGTIEHIGEQAFATHMICAIFQYSGTTTINGGVISTPNYRSVRLWKGNMTINGGEFDGQLWVQAVDNTANLVITDGTFGPNGGDGSSVFVENKTHEVAVNITGGTFTTKLGASNAVKGWVKGGQFGVDPSAYVAEGYKAIKNGTVWTVKTWNPVASVEGVEYEKLADALTAAGTTKVVTLLANATVSQQCIIKENGKTLTITGNFAKTSKKGDGNAYVYPTTEWKLVGNIANFGNWAYGSSKAVMLKEHETVVVIRNVTLAANNEFKFCKDGSWNDGTHIGAYGTGGTGNISYNSWYGVDERWDKFKANIKNTTAGTYDIFFATDNGNWYVAKSSDYKEVGSF